jgi:hypothetical protein
LFAEIINIAPTEEISINAIISALNFLFFLRKLSEKIITKTRRNIMMIFISDMNVVSETKLETSFTKKLFAAKNIAKKQENNPIR